MRTIIPLEEQCRVVHIPVVDAGVQGVLRYIKSEALRRHYHPVSAAEPQLNDPTGKATYLFDTVVQTVKFSQGLSERGIAYSTHLAKDYLRLATEGMDQINAALFSAFAPE